LEEVLNIETGITNIDYADNDPEMIISRDNIWISTSDPKKRVYITGRCPAYASGDCVISSSDWNISSYETGYVITGFSLETHQDGAVRLILELHPAFPSR